MKVLHETRLPDCYYFPKSIVDQTVLEPSDYRTFCPFKGTASYWHVNTAGGTIQNGAWAYETPLGEAEEIGGLVAFSHQVAHDYGFEVPPRTGVEADGHINSALTDWILREAGFCSTREELIGQLGKKFVESGISVFRLNVTIWSLHPEIAGMNYRWLRETDEMTISEPSYDLFSNPSYLNSPLRLVSQGLGGVRQPLTGDNVEFEFAIMEDLKAEGATDYVAMPLRFSDGQTQIMTLACDHADGFTTENLGLIFECVGAISRYIEVLTLRANTTTLLHTYLGRRTGQKVLAGDVRRGQGEDINAVILFSDLRNSSKLAEELPRAEYLKILNTYFETVLGPIDQYGGEVLKFIGDAVLAIFPVTSGGDDNVLQARNAVAAARAITGTLEKSTGADAENGTVEIDFGIALHVGDVTYGNVGGRDRLDFTVIGPAVNMASRLEGLCKSTGKRVIVSSDLRASLEGRLDPARSTSASDDTSELKSLGHHALAGVAEAQEIFALS